MTDKISAANATIAEASTASIKAEPRKVLDKNHPVVAHLTNRRGHILGSGMLTAEDKATAVAFIDEALGVLTNEN